MPLGVGGWGAEWEVCTPAFAAATVGKEMSVDCSCVYESSIQCRSSSAGRSCLTASAWDFTIRVSFCGERRKKKKEKGKMELVVWTPLHPPPPPPSGCE